MIKLWDILPLCKDFTCNTLLSIVEYLTNEAQERSVTFQEQTPTVWSHFEYILLFRIFGKVIKHFMACLYHGPWVLAHSLHSFSGLAHLHSSLLWTWLAFRAYLLVVLQLTRAATCTLFSLSLSVSCGQVSYIIHGGSVTFILSWHP